MLTITIFTQLCHYCLLQYLCKLMSQIRFSLRKRILLQSNYHFYPMNPKPPLQQHCLLSLCSYHHAKTRDLLSLAVFG